MVIPNVGSDPVLTRHTVSFFRRNPQRSPPPELGLRSTVDCDTEHGRPSGGDGQTRTMANVGECTLYSRGSLSFFSHRVTFHLTLFTPMGYPYPI